MEYSPMQAHRTYAKIDHSLGHETNLKKFKRTETIQSMFSDHNGVIEINSRKITGKLPELSEAAAHF